MKNIINNLSLLVDEVIEKEMGKFKRLGTMAKSMANAKADEHEISKIHSNMSSIFKDLKPLEQRTRYLYPEMCGLFDLLMNNKKEEHEQRKN